MKEQRRADRKRAWIEPCARIGYGVRAILYAVVGILAAQMAAGLGRREADTHGAIEAIAGAPSGGLLLALVAAGLAAYALWRFTQGILDTEGKGKDAKGLAVRAGYIGSGVVNAGLAVAAVRFILGARKHGSDIAREWTERLLLAPMGSLLVGLAGGAFICGGIYQLYKAFSEKFRRRLKTAEMPSETDRWVSRISKVGLTARGVVYGLIGTFLIRAAMKADPEEARDAGRVLDEIFRGPYGEWLLGAMAAGFIAYAVYALVNAVYRRIGTASYGA